MDSLTLFAEIERARKYGAVYLDIHQKLENKDWREIVFESLVKSGISITEFSSSLIQIDESKALSIIMLLLHKDMAYESEIMPIKRAERLAENFCSMFSSQADYFSNSTWNKNEYHENKFFELGLSEWSPFTEATFDSGIIICDTDKVGIAWFEDED